MRSKINCNTGQTIWKAERGAVSIYLLITTAAIVLLAAVLIDYARIAAFRKQAELAVKSGVRSVLSAYDTALYNRYGLFIRGGDVAGSIFETVLQGHVMPTDEGLGFLSIRWDAVDVTESRPLADHIVFRRQIAEEMKYKAPIDFTLELAGRMKGVLPGLQEAAETTDMLERMREAYDRREESLDRMLEDQIRFGTESVRLLTPIMSDPPAAFASHDLMSEARHIGDTVNQYADYTTKKADDRAREAAIREQEERRKTIEESGGKFTESPLEPPRYEQEIAAYEASVRKQAAEAFEGSSALKQLAERFVLNVQSALQEARRANNEMREIAKEQTITADSTVGEAEQSLDEVREAARQLVLEEAFFASYESEVLQQEIIGVTLSGEAQSWASLISNVPDSSGLLPQLTAQAEALQQAFYRHKIGYGPEGEVIDQRQRLLQEHRSHDEARKEQEQLAKREWAGAKRFLEGLIGQSGSMEEQESFTRLHALAEQNLAWNKAAAEQRASTTTGNPSAGRDMALSAASELFGLVEKMLVGARDQLYFSEYAFTRMSHYPPAQIREMIRGGDVPLGMEVQEAEYIVYGMNNPSANIAAAYGEIFAIRLAIRTMEGLIESRGAGHPLLVLAASLVYGITHSIADMNLLINEGHVQLSKAIKMDTYYADYLRLFLMLHGGSANQTARMIAVMEYRTGVSFQGAYTYASGEGTGSIPLLFMPGVTKLIGNTASGGGQVIGKRYEASYTADMSY